MSKRRLNGIVISTANQKTVSVMVRTRKKHPKYGKTILLDKKYMAHDPKESFSVGDAVIIEESRPISKTKKWIVMYDL